MNRKLLHNRIVFTNSATVFARLLRRIYSHHNFSGPLLTVYYCLRIGFGYYKLPKPSDVYPFIWKCFLIATTFDYNATVVNELSVVHSFASSIFVIECGAVLLLRQHKRIISYFVQWWQWDFCSEWLMNGRFFLSTEGEWSTWSICLSLHTQRKADETD